MSLVLLRNLSRVNSSAAVILTTTTKSAQLLSLSLSNKYTENRRKMSGFLIDEPKYAFLKELGIEKRNHGVFNGKWGGSGDVSHRLFTFSFVYSFSKVKKSIFPAICYFLFLDFDFDTCTKYKIVYI